MRTQTAKMRVQESPDHLFTLKVPVNGRFIVIHAFDANHTDPRSGHQRIDIEVRFGGKVIFPRGATWCAVNCCTSINSNEAMNLVMATVAMKPGDTDREYFDTYTPEQLAFAERYGEYISMASYLRYGDL